MFDKTSYKPWAVFFEDDKRHDMSTRDLVALVSDLASWQAFLAMLVNGIPARMTMQRTDGVETTIVVVRARMTSPHSTFEEPYKGGRAHPSG